MRFSDVGRLRAFSAWLRTGRRPAASDVEVKFNPYHDPRNGRFTFAPGGPRSLQHVVISGRRKWHAQEPPQAETRDDKDEPREQSRLSEPAITNAVYQVEPGRPILQRAAFNRAPGGGSRGSNSRAFHDPMTLEQVFPTLRNAPGGALLGLADNLFNLTGPGRDLTTELTVRWTRQLVSQIKAIDPTYRFESFGPPVTLQGQVNQLNALRFDRAEAFMRVKGELRPLQVETLRFLQQRVDRAYERGLELLRSEKLRVRLSEQEALGNYIDSQVRAELRERYRVLRIDSAGNGPVRVNRRERYGFTSELTFRVPDARVGGVLFDMTLSLKTLKNPQVRDFFRAESQPSHLVVVRPSQLGPGHTYIVPRPEAKR